MNGITKPRWLGGALAALIASCAISSALAQPYPSRPIRLIVTFPPGGSTDVMARAIQPHLEKHLGQPLVLQSRPRAGAIIAVDAIAKSAPDGYLIGIGDHRRVP